MDITPLRDYIVIEVQQAQTRTASGLEIAQGWKDLPPYGVILATGPLVEDERLKAGVRVLFARYAAIQIGESIEKEDKGIRLIAEKHILGIKEEGDNAR